MVRITPVEIKSKEDCLAIVRPSAYYRTLSTLDKIRYLRQEFPIRLEKVNELVWKNYPTHKISKLQEIAIRFDSLADKTMNTELKNDFNSMKELINNLLFFFKNYQEMVAYTTLLYYETDTLVNEENIELLQLKERFNILEKESFALKDKLRVFDFLVTQTELLTNQLKIAQQDLNKYKKHENFEKIRNINRTVITNSIDKSTSETPMQLTEIDSEEIDSHKKGDRQEDGQIQETIPKPEIRPRNNKMGRRPTGLKGQVYDVLLAANQGLTLNEIIQIINPTAKGKEKKKIRATCDNLALAGTVKKDTEERGVVFSLNKN